MQNKENAELVAGLKQLIAFIEANDDFQFVTGEDKPAMLHWREWYVRKADETQRRAMISDLAKRLGTSEKAYSGDYFWLRHNFGPHVQLEVTSLRHVVCERVVTGTKVVPAHGEYTLPAEPERTEEIVEWRCVPILAASEVSA